MPSIPKSYPEHSCNPQGQRSNIALPGPGGALSPLQSTLLSIVCSVVLSDALITSLMIATGYKCPA